MSSIRSVSITVNKSKESSETKTVLVGSGNLGNPLVIDAKDKALYDFVDSLTGYAPHNVLVKRSGKDLTISFKKGDAPDVIIKDFYDVNSDGLVGQTEDGDYYYYVPETGQSDDFIPNLNEGSDGEWHALGPVEPASFLFPWWLVGSLALAGGVLAAIGGGGGDDSEPTVAPVQLLPTISVDVSSDSSDTTPTIIGTTNQPAGSMVTVVVTDSEGNTQTITTVVKDPDGNPNTPNIFEVDVPTPLKDGEITVIATVKDPEGNTATDDDTGKIDTVAPVASIIINEISADGYINLAESGQAITPISGTVGDDVKQGDTVSVTVNGVVYTTTVAVEKTWTVNVNTSDLMADTDKVIDARVATTDEAGNISNTATDTEDYTVDITAPTITVDAPDNSNDNTPTITGTTDVPAGETVTLIVTDSAGEAQTITAIVTDPDGNPNTPNTYTVDVVTPLADGDYTVVATVKDPAGNTATDNDTGKIDTTAPVASITINEISTDGYINIAESGQATTPISGTVGDDVQQGDTVSVTVNGVLYTTTVAADSTWTVDVNTSDLLADADKVIDASVTTTDSVGNVSNTATDTEDYVVDTTAPVASITVNEISTDGFINIVESGQTVTPISGTVGDDVKQGDMVSVTVNGVVYTTTVAADNTWTVDVNTSDLLADTDKVIEASVTTTDPAGNVSNTATDTEDYVVDTTAPTITVDAPDNSSDNTPTITGTTDVPAGTTVTLIVTDSAGNPQTITAIVTDPDGNPNTPNNYTSDVATPLADGDYTVVATVKDPAGNEGTATDPGNVLRVDAPSAIITIDPTFLSTTAVLTATITVTSGVYTDDTYTTFIPTALSDNLTAADLSVTFGTLGALSAPVMNADGSQTYTVTVTPNGTTSEYNPVVISLVDAALVNTVGLTSIVASDSSLPINEAPVVTLNVTTWNENASNTEVNTAGLLPQQHVLQGLVSSFTDVEHTADSSSGSIYTLTVLGQAVGSPGRTSFYASTGVTTPTSVTSVISGTGNNTLTLTSTSLNDLYASLASYAYVPAPLNTSSSESLSNIRYTFTLSDGANFGYNVDGTESTSALTNAQTVTQDLLGLDDTLNLNLTQTYFTGEGNDSVKLTADGASVYLGVGDDYAHLTAVNQTAFGGSGSDTVWVNTLDGRVLAGIGADTVVLMAGSSGSISGGTATAGDGAVDTFYFSADVGSLINIEDFELSFDRLTFFDVSDTNGNGTIELDDVVIDVTGGVVTLFNNEQIGLYLNGTPVSINGLSELASYVTNVYGIGDLEPQIPTPIL